MDEFKEPRLWLAITIKMGGLTFPVLIQIPICIRSNSFHFPLSTYLTTTKMQWQIDLCLLLNGGSRSYYFWASYPLQQ